MRGCKHRERVASRRQIEGKGGLPTTPVVGNAEFGIHRRTIARNGVSSGATDADRVVDCVLSAECAGELSAATATTDHLWAFGAAYRITAALSDYVALAHPEAIHFLTAAQRFDSPPQRTIRRLLLPGDSDDLVGGEGRANGTVWSYVDAHVGRAGGDGAGFRNRRREGGSRRFGIGRRRCRRWRIGWHEGRRVGCLWRRACRRGDLRFRVAAKGCRWWQ